MVAKCRQCSRRGAATTATLRLFVGQNRHGAIEADGEDLFGILQVGERAVMADVRPVATDTSGDHLAGFWMLPDVARQ